MSKQNHESISKVANDLIVKGLEAIQREKNTVDATHARATEA